MKLYSVFTLLFFSSQIFAGSLSTKVCLLIGERKYFQTAEKWCESHEKHFCKNITWGAAICKISDQHHCDHLTWPQGICQANGAHFCNDADSLAEGVCLAVQGHFCSIVEDDPKQKKKYIDIYQNCGGN